jgi:phytoene synthase
VIAPELAYARCEQITRSEARNFAYGIRLLPPAKRQAMSALYAFARRVDDIGDGASAVDVKLGQLAATRSTLARVVDHDPPEEDAVFVALADALVRFPIPIGALEEVVAGCEMDCRTSRYGSFDELAGYCSLVAGSIGRLSLGVFGPSDTERAPGLADTLGLALQLTNILRDIVEDRDVMGRVYLPEEDLTRFGCTPDASGPNDALAELVRFECGRARALYSQGLELLGLLDRRSRACVSAMAGIYFRLLGRIEAEPLAVLDHRVSVPTWEKLVVAARSLAGVA